MSRVMYPELKKQLMHRNKTSMIPFFFGSEKITSLKEQSNSLEPVCFLAERDDFFSLLLDAYPSGNDRISHPKSLLKMIFLLPWWDMLVSCRVKIPANSVVDILRYPSVYTGFRSIFGDSLMSIIVCSK